MEIDHLKSELTPPKCAYYQRSWGVWVKSLGKDSLVTRTWRKSLESSPIQTEYLTYLVGGAITILKNEVRQWQKMTSHRWKVKKTCLKPPTSDYYPLLTIINHHYPILNQCSKTFPNHQPVIYDVHCGVHWVHTHIHFFWFPVTFQSSSSDFTCRGVAIAASTTCRSSLGRRLSAIPGWEKNANGPSYHWQWKMVHVEKNNSIWKDIQKRNYVKKKVFAGEGCVWSKGTSRNKRSPSKKTSNLP